MYRACEFLFALLLGFAAGFTSGAFGVGGGIITTPAIRMLLQRSSDIALGTPLPITFPSALVGGLNYWRAGKVDHRIVVTCALFGLAGTGIGSSVTAFMDTRYIMIVTALVIIYLSWRTALAALGRDLYGRLEAPTERERAPLWKLGAIGFTAGFFSGFLGLGGGFIMVPAFFFLLRLEIKECLGNSLVIITILSIPGSVIHGFLGHVDWALAFAMTLGVMPGAFTGSFFTLRARNRRVLLLFSLLLLAIGIIFMTREIMGLV
ncbi:MAG: sulfite exporter TauE/SafE family protein [Actinomycetota bacterium]|nr:sulfite exporter TauE/SafE family protein [Actinomycetota bacterium]